VTMHGRAELFDVLDPAHGELRQAMLDFYLPKQGPAFESWLENEDPLGRGSRRRSCSLPVGAMSPGRSARPCRSASDEALPDPQVRQGGLHPDGGRGDEVPLVLLGQLLHLSGIDHVSTVRPNADRSGPQ